MTSGTTLKAQKIGGMALAVVSVAVTVADGAYRAIMGISFANRVNCFIYQEMNRAAFILFENVVELGIAVYLGCFAATVFEKYATPLKGFLPKNPIVAFVYGSLIPVCSCSAIPLVNAMRNTLNLRTTITFIVAAPLLNPYLIFLSFTALGPFYGIARIAGAFVLSVTAGYAIDFVARRSVSAPDIAFMKCDARSCQAKDTDIFVGAMRLFAGILPFLAIGALLSVCLEYCIPDKNFALARVVSETLWGNLSVIALGIPLYLCNGADIFILRPLIQEAGLSMGTAIEFSLASNAICITSVLMLMKILGKRLALTLVAHIAVVVLIIGYAVNYIGRLLNAT